MKTIAPNDYVRLVKNILDNSLKCSNKNSAVEIIQNKYKHDIIIKVKDNGIGVSAKDKLAIGGRFYRASNTGTIDGTGLGLAIVHKILNYYGGSINIVSKINVGTTVTITLPT